MPRRIKGDFSLRIITVKDMWSLESCGHWSKLFNLTSVTVWILCEITCSNLTSWSFKLDPSPRDILAVPLVDSKWEVIKVHFSPSWSTSCTHSKPRPIIDPVNGIYWFCSILAQNSFFIDIVTKYWAFKRSHIVHLVTISKGSIRTI